MSILSDINKLYIYIAVACVLCITLFLLSLKNFIRRYKADVKFYKVLDKGYLLGCVAWLIIGAIQYRSIVEYKTLLIILYILFSLKFFMDAFYTCVADSKGMIYRSVPIKWENIKELKYVENPAYEKDIDTYRTLQVLLDDTRFTRLFKSKNTVEIKVLDKECEKLEALIVKNTCKTIM